MKKRMNLRANKFWKTTIIQCETCLVWEMLSRRKKPKSYYNNRTLIKG